MDKNTSEVLKGCLLVVVAAPILSIVAAGSAVFFIALDSGEPIFPEFFLFLFNRKKSTGIFFTILGLWLTGSSIVGKRRLENWDRSIKEWGSQRGNKFLIRTMGLLGGIGISFLIIVFLTKLEISGFVGGSMIIMVFFVFPWIFIYFLINIPVAFSLFLYRTLAYAEDNDVLERTLTAIGLLCGTVGVFLMLD